MTGVSCTFRLSWGAHHVGNAPTQLTHASREVWEEVQMQWSEGRHGDKGEIVLSTRSQDRIPEVA